jgi:hypothetical protein
MEQEDDWENIEIPDLYILIKNKEKEQRLLEERKLVEDADAELTEDLFSRQNINKQKNINLTPIPTTQIQVKKKPTEFLEKRQQELKKTQIEESQKKREKNTNNMRLKEIYGEAEDDIYDDIADKYCG